jgi:hypothetical protein
MRYATLPLVIGIVATLQCTMIGPSPAEGELVVGRWGGAHVALTLTDSGGTIEYDCAHGGLGAPVRLGRAGRFEIAGVHVREHGGPIRVGEVPDSLPARYAGQVRGDRMTLRVIVGADTLGPFELRRGAEPQLLKCL